MSSIEMKDLNIAVFQAKTIENALRLTANLNECRSETTAYDREVILAIKHIKQVLEQIEK